MSLLVLAQTFCTYDQHVAWTCSTAEEMSKNLLIEGVSSYASHSHEGADWTGNGIAVANFLDIFDRDLANDQHLLWLIILFFEPMESFLQRHIWCFTPQLPLQNTNFCLDFSERGPAVSITKDNNVLNSSHFNHAMQFNVVLNGSSKEGSIILVTIMTCWIEW